MAYLGGDREWSNDTREEGKTGSAYPDLSLSLTDNTHTHTYIHIYFIHMKHSYI